MSLNAEVAIEIAKLRKGLADAKRELRKYKSDSASEGKGLGDSFFGGFSKEASGHLGQLKGLIAASLGAAAIKGTLSHYDDLADAALRLGESVETLQRVEHASKELASVDMNGLVAEMLKLEKALGDPENEKGAEALAHYGLTAEHLASLPLDQKLLAISEAFQKSRVDGTGYNDLLALLGKSAGAIIPLLTQTKEKIQEVFGQAAVVDNKTVQELADLNDQFDRYYETAKALVALNLGKIFESFRFNATWLTEGHDAALAEKGNAEGDANFRDQKSRHDQKKQAKNIGSLNAAAADEAGQKKRESALERLNQLEAQLRDKSVDALPDPEKLAALQSEIANFFSTLPADFVSQYGASIEGMRALATEMKAAGEFKIAEGILKQVQEISALVDKAASVQEKLDEKATRAAEKRKKDLQAATEAEREFLSPEQRLASLRDELRAIFSEANVKPGDLAALKNADPEAYGKALKNIKQGAESGGTMGQSVGTVQNAINIFSGRGPMQIAEEQRDLLRDANGYLKTIAEKGSGSAQSPLGIPVFAQPA